MGALIDQGHMQRVLGYIDSGISQGARVALGGKRAFEEFGGYYVEATVLDGVRADMRVAREEIFGPVLTVTSFTDEAEAVRLANDTIYGLAAAVWTSDMNVAHRLSGALQGRHGVGQHLRPLIAGHPLRRLQTVRVSAAIAPITRSTSTPI